MMTPEDRAARIAQLDAELTRLVATREREAARAFQDWSFGMLPEHFDERFPGTPILTALDTRIHRVFDELERLTDEQETES